MVPGSCWPSCDARLSLAAASRLKAFGDQSWIQRHGPLRQSEKPYVQKHLVALQAGRLAHLKRWACALTSTLFTWLRRASEATEGPQGRQGRRRRYPAIPGEERLDLSPAEKRKWRKEQRWLQKKERRRSQRAAERQRAARRKKAALQEKLADKSEEERKAYWEEQQRLKVAREQSVRQAFAHGNPKVVINCSFGDLMPARDNKSLASQVKLAYAFLKRSMAHVQLHVTSLEDTNPALPYFKAVGMDGWQVHVHKESVWDLYRTEDLVVLSPDADEDLDQVEEDKIYVIGGLVDRRPQKKRSRTQAEAQGGSIQLRKLPLKRFAPKGSYPILNIDVVVKILAQRKLRRGPDAWPDILSNCIPHRHLSRNDKAPDTLTKCCVICV
ncbi:unnamed protein product [Cladocopium goreaui]|uniref:tRNA (guanine(9)-N(1))-methyltransferase n=1 Tax=Cladocopium goreaui TaxID=2562237 RepID=A0A9P1D675_9DINO|nr:unnamed protein product [Cladocopium goreaui]